LYLEIYLFCFCVDALRKKEKYSVGTLFFSKQQLNFFAIVLLFLAIPIQVKAQEASLPIGLWNYPGSQTFLQIQKGKCSLKLDPKFGGGFASGDCAWKSTSQTGGILTIEYFQPGLINGAHLYYSINWIDKNTLHVCAVAANGAMGCDIYKRI
jgi:hypothetical protein